MCATQITEMPKSKLAMTCILTIVALYGSYGNSSDKSFVFKRHRNIKLVDYKLNYLVDWTILCNSFGPGFLLLCSTGNFRLACHHKIIMVVVISINK